MSKSILHSDVIWPLLSAALLVGCTGSDPGGPLPAGVGRVETSLTSAVVPAGGMPIQTMGPSKNLKVKEIIVTVTKVTAHSTSGGWQTLSNKEVQVDILKLAQYAEQLGFKNMPTGKVTQVRLYLPENGTQYVTRDDGVRVDLKVPSGMQSGIKLKGMFDVSGCQLTSLPIEFDGKHSIWVHPTGQGEEWILRPVIRMGKIEASNIGCTTPGGSTPGGSTPGGPSGLPDGIPEGSPNGTPVGNPNGNPYGNPDGTPNGTPTGAGGGAGTGLGGGAGNGSTGGGTGLPGSGGGTALGGSTGGGAGGVIEAPGSGTDGTGTACANSATCLSGACINGLCGAGGADVPCRLGSDCVSGTCGAEATCTIGTAKGTGSACTANTQCLSSGCVNGVCIEGSQGAPCSVGGDCAVGFACTSGSCVPTIN